LTAAEWQTETTDDQIMKMTIVIVAALLAAHIVIYPRMEDVQPIAWFGNLSQALVLMIAAYHLIRVWRLSARDDHMIWGLLASGMCLWILAQAFITYSEIALTQNAYGTVADGFWILGYAAFIRSIYLLNAPHCGPRWLLAGAVVGMVGYALLYLAIQPAAIPGAERSSMMKFLDFIYPACDLWLAMFAFGYAPYASRRRTWVILGLAFGVILVADAAFAHYTDVNSPGYRALDLIFFPGYGLLAIFGALAYAEKARQPKLKPAARDAG
jgi:hypothetical protein